MCVTLDPSMGSVSPADSKLREGKKWVLNENLDVSFHRQEEWVLGRKASK